MSRWRFAILLVLTLWHRALWSAEAELEKPVPADTCVVELNLPPGATISVDGRDYATQRRFTFSPLKPGRLVSTKFVAKFANGETEERVIWLDPGQRLRAALRPNDKRLPELYIQSGHAGGAFRSAFSRDGKYLVTSNGPTAILWDVATGRSLRTYSGFNEDIQGFGFDVDGKRIVAASMDKTAIVWDRDTGRVLKKFNVGSCFIATLTPDGRTLATGGLDQIVTLWNFDTGNKLRAFDKRHSEYIKRIAFSPDGRLAASSDEDHLVIVYDVASGHALYRLPKIELGPDELSFSPDSSKLLIGCFEYEPAVQGGLILWDVVKQTQLGTFRAKNRIPAAFVDGGRAVTAAVTEEQGRGSFVVFDTDALREVRRISCPKSWTMNLSPDGTLFDGNALRELPNLSVIREFASTQCDIQQVNWADEDQIAFIGDGTVRLWDPRAATSTLLSTKMQEGEHAVEFVWLARAKQALAMVHHAPESALMILDPSTPTASRRFELPTKIRSATASADGRTALIESETKALLWDLTRGQQAREFPMRRYANLSADARWVIVEDESTNRFGKSGADSQKTFRFATIWDAQTGTLVRPLEFSVPIDKSNISMFDLEFLGFTNDSTRAVTAGSKSEKTGERGWIGLWNLQTGELTTEFTSPEPIDLRHVSFSSSDKIMAAKCDNNTVLVWDVESRRHLRTFPSFEFLNSPALSPDGRRILTVLDDNTVGLWDVLTGDLLCRFATFNKGEDWLVVTPEGLFDGSPAARQYVSWRIGGGLNLVPVDRFFQDFYRPGLMAEIVRGQRAFPEVQIAKTQPPRIKIVSPKAGEVDSQTVTIAVEAVDQGGGVSRVAIYQNGARVLADGENRRDGQTLFRSFKMSLVEGKNHFRVTAASGDGSWEAEAAEIVLSYERPLAKSQLHLVAIGVSRYADGNLNLEYAAKDAQGMTDLFQRRGKGLYDKVNVTTVTDEQATRDGIKSALKNAAAETRPQDTLVLFLAGHGAMVGQRYFFVPHDLRRKAEQLEDDLRTQGLPADELSDYLGAAKALKRVLILDTCSSGGALQVAVKGRSGFALRGAIERLSRTQGVFTIAAASATEEAKESKELGHGVLSYALLAGLKGVNRGPLDGKAVQPSGPERVVDVMEWFTFAAAQVPRLTEKLYGVSQDVQTSTQGNSFPVLPLEE